MTDGNTVPSAALYSASNIYSHITDPSSVHSSDTDHRAEDAAADIRAELVNALRSREDKGLRFWMAIRDLAASFEDRPLPLPPQPVTQTTAEVVYYLRFGDRVKIGTTRNLANRLTAIPHDEVLAVEAGGRDVELQRHRQFASIRIIGEWFAYDDALKQHIATL